MGDVRAGRLPLAACMVAAATLLVSSCSPGRRPFLQAQFCVDSDERSLLIDAVKEIARTDNMTFADGSAEIDAVALHQREVTGIAEVRRGPIISLSVYSGPNGSVSFNNNGLQDQIFLGFGAADDEQKAAAFAERVLQRLASQWDVVRASGETGMQSLTCPGTAKAPSQAP